MMKNELSGAEAFAKTLKLRELFKRLSQLTWGIREAEQKFPIQTNSADLLFLYEGFLNELFDISNEAKIEVPKNQLERKGVEGT